MIRLAVNARFVTQPCTGVQRYAMEMSGRLAGLEGVELFSPRRPFADGRYEGIRVTQTGRLSGHAWEQAELPAHLASIGNPLLLNLANTAPALHRRQIVTVHDLAFIRNPSWFSWRFGAYYRMLVPLIVRRAERIVTVSGFSKGEIASLLGADASKIAVVSGAVSGKYTPGPSRSKKEIGRYVLMVSSLDPRKNIAGALEAFSLLGDRDLKLVLVGASGRAFAGKAVDLPGFANVIHRAIADDDELVDLYRGAELLCYPSFYEGFGLPPLEAMACGCPAVVSDIPPHREACGDAAMFVDPQDTAAISAAMKSVIEDLAARQSLIERGLERVKMSSWDSSFNGLLEVLGECGCRLT
jgi:glycosyltransferase involved in cell wall biosynthesis